MKLIDSCVIAISMYSRIPMPRVEWREDGMRQVMCFFPLVGILVGLILGGWLYLALEVLQLSPAAAALWGTAVPILVTGGIHMDGFLDTMDAIHSYGDREKKLEILKDSHVGAFAVIGTAVYLLLYAGAMYEFVLRISIRTDRTALYFAPVCFLSMERAFSGLSVVLFPSARKQGMAAAFAQAAEKRTDRRILIGWIAFLPLISWVLGGTSAALRAAVWLAVQLAAFGWYYRMSVKEFGGMTGDLAGCFLQICELLSFTAAVGLLTV